MMRLDIAARDDLAALKMAVQVLTAIIEGCTPDSTDVEQLRRFAPLLADLPIDELACNIADAELKRRKVMRKGEGALNWS